MRIYKKKAWGSYNVRTSRHLSSRMLPKSRTRNMQSAHAYIYYMSIYHIRMAYRDMVYLYVGIYCGFSWLGVNLRDSGVIQSVSKRQIQYILSCRTYKCPFWILQIYRKLLLLHKLFLIFLNMLFFVLYVIYCFSLSAFKVLHRFLPCYFDIHRHGFLYNYFT